VSARAHMIINKLSASLLLAAAAYVLFYWGRVVFGDVMVENPIVSAGDKVAAALRGWLTIGSGRWLPALAFGVLLLIGLTGYVKALLKLKGPVLPPHAEPPKNKSGRT